MSALRCRLAAACLLLSAPLAQAAVKPGLEGAQDLFRRNRWEEARAHLRAQWAALPAKDQAAATFLIGRSCVREAEFYRAARQLGIEVGLAYYKELLAQRSNRSVALVPLFASFYQLEAGEDREAERGLLAAEGAASLPPEWRATARLRRAVALSRLAGGPVPALQQPSAEARFWRLLLTSAADPSVAAADRRERLLAAPVLFRASRAAAAESLLAAVDLDLPDAESKADPRKLLRFHDPLLAAAWERVCWERAALALRPLAAAGTGTERVLAGYYLGLSLVRLGAPGEAVPFLQPATTAAELGPLQSTARLLLAASSWKGRVPPASELLPLWEATQAQPEAVLAWDELRRKDLLRAEPYATRLDARLNVLLPPGERAAGALVASWALARLRRGDDPGSLVALLSEHRDDANKNKIDWNDPLLLLALAAANARSQQYAQSLETLFELSKSFPGLRWLQWNLQGVYAARQKAGGETRISQ